jgi:uncharacterized membrane protein
VPDRPSSLERLVFFSDAVFAIAITLLAINLHLPALTSNDNAGLLQALWDARAAYFAFFLSFFTAGAFWIGHVRTLHSVTRTDGWFFWLNLLFLFFVALLPFPTSVLAEHGDVPFAAAAYAVFVGLTGLVATIVWVYAARVGKLTEGVDPDMARDIAIRTLVTPVLFAASIPIALVSLTAAEIVWLASFPATAFVSRRLGLRAAMDRSLSSE